MVKRIASAMPRLGVFIPTMQPTYADYDEVMRAHNGRTLVGIKHDGYRVQVHKGNKRLWIFTRNGNELNYDCYPDIVSFAERLPVCIIDAEMVGEGRNHKAVYDCVKSRFRRPGIRQDTVDEYLESGMVERSPLSLRVFDTLRFRRRTLLGRCLEEREEYTMCFDLPGIVPVEQKVAQTSAELESLVEGSFSECEEGVVCRDPCSVYRPGSSSIDWVKFKRSETLDLVVVGFYTSSRVGLPFTSVLCATYDSKSGRYQTLGKVAVARKGISEEIFENTRGNMSRHASVDVCFSGKLERGAYSHHVPDAYIDPELSVVLEVKTMNIYRSENWQTCGLENGKAFSMRIGYANQLRLDKRPRQCTTTDAVWKLYALQEGGGCR
jgi:ATP-dependent DNA ligase